MKNLFKKSIACLLAVVICLTLIPASVFAAETEGKVIDSGECGKNATYTLYESGLMKISGKGQMYDYPEKHIYHGVEDTRPYKDHLDKIKEVVIAKGITYIGALAFRNCENLTKITLPAGLKTIGAVSMASCKKLKSIDIPASVTSIKSGAFERCESLTEAIIPEGVQEIGHCAFFGCKNLKKVVIPKSIKQKNGDDPLGDEIFSYCPNLETVIFRCNVTWSGSRIFDEAKAVIYYPANDPGYTDSFKRATGYDCTWVPYDPEFTEPVVKSSNVASSGKIKLTWNKVEGAVKYKVYRSTAKFGKYSLMKTVTGGTSYTNTNAVPGKYYYYYVLAVGADGKNSARHSIVGRTCDLAKPVVKITTASGKPKLSWNKVEGAVSYKVYRATSKDGKYTLMKTVKNATTYTNLNAVKGKTYYYKVMAVHSKSAANSPYSAVKSIKCTK